VYTTESYPTSFRASGMGGTSVWYRIGATITPLVGSWLLSTGYVLPYVTFGTALTLAGILAIFLPFETLGRQAEDVPDESRLGHAELLKTGVEEAIVKIGSPQYEEEGYREYGELATVDEKE
jgi:MFS family permease